VEQDNFNTAELNISEENKIKHIGILTSGGDAPGMNAAIRAVVRTALFHKVKVTGIMRGYEGLLSADIKELSAREVSDILYKGGTTLLTARSKEMMTPEGQERAAQICKILKLDALVVIGGDGSLKGALALKNLGINVMGIPGTIDLDLNCTDYTIGFDTAITTGVDAIGKIKDTSSSHERCSIIEVMGRNAGHIALWCAMTGGAEEVLIPEKSDFKTEDVITQIITNRAKGKKHNLIIVAEGIGGSQELAKQIQDSTGIQTRSTILGHIQRGGSPTVVDRMHGSMMGCKAVEWLLAGEKNKIVIYEKGAYAHVPIEEINNTERRNPTEDNMYDIIKMLSI